MSKKQNPNQSGESNFSNILYRQISLGTSLLSLAGLIIGTAFYLTNPSRDNDTAIQLQQQRIDAQAATIETLTKTQQNDTHEQTLAVGRLEAEIKTLDKTVTQLMTIIDERIPKKK